MILKDGFRVDVAEDALDDWEVTEALCEMDGGSLAKLPFVIERLLGKYGKAALTEHLRNENGRVKTSDMLAAITEIFEGMKDAKKS